MPPTRRQPTWSFAGVVPSSEYVWRPTMPMYWATFPTEDRQDAQEEPVPPTPLTHVNYHDLGSLPLLTSYLADMQGPVMSRSTLAWLRGESPRDLRTGRDCRMHRIGPGANPGDIVQLAPGSRWAGIGGNPQALALGVLVEVRDGAPLGFGVEWPGPTGGSPGCHWYSEDDLTLVLPSTALYFTRALYEIAVADRASVRSGIVAANIAERGITARPPTTTTPPEPQETEPMPGTVTTGENPFTVGQRVRARPGTTASDYAASGSGAQGRNLGGVVQELDGGAYTVIRWDSGESGGHLNTDLIPEPPRPVCTGEEVFSVSAVKNASTDFMLELNIAMQQDLRDMVDKLTRPWSGYPHGSVAGVKILPLLKSGSLRIELFASETDIRSFARAIGEVLDHLITVATPVDYTLVSRVGG